LGRYKSAAIALLGAGVFLVVVASFMRAAGVARIGLEYATDAAYAADQALSEVCVGDCDGNNMVTIDELILGINIALGKLSVNTCPAFANSQGVVNVAQLVAGVDGALNGCSPPTTPLTVAVPLAGTVAQGTPEYYSGAVTLGTAYSVSIVGLSGAANIAVFNDPAFRSQVCLTGSTSSQAKECTFTASGDTAFIRVDGQLATAAETTYTAFLIERPSVVSPVSEGTRNAPIAIADGVPRIGQVSTRDTSYYAVTGLTSDEPHFVAITGLSGAADLHVFTDALDLIELNCTLNNVASPIGIAQDCTVNGSSALYFSVSSGATNRDGAAYEMLVE
jgi:hypothetical protein